MGVSMQICCTGLIGFLCLSVAIMFAWPSSTLRLFESTNTTLHRPMTNTELSLLGSLSAIGSFIGIPVTGVLLDKNGRKYCSIIGALLNVLCWVLISTSNRVEVVLTSVFMSGLGGSVFVAVPVYISEICQQSIRGALISGSMVFNGIGLLLSYLLGGYLEYYTMIYVSLTLAVTGLVMVSFLRESPVYLMAKGLEEEAARSIAFYRGVESNDKEVLEEINKIRRSFNPDMDIREVVYPEEERLNPVTEPVQKLSLWQFIGKSRSTRRAMFVILVLIIASIFQGLVVIQVYAVPLFSEAIPTMSSTLCSILLAVVGVVAGLVAAYLTELAGRRSLMIYSSIGCGVCCILLGTQIHLNWGPNWMTAVFIYLFTGVYIAGAGTVPFVLTAEVFLPEVKSFVSMLVMELMNVCNAIILFIFNPLVNTIGLGSLFYIFSVFCFLTAVFCQFFLPETKGMSVDAIQVAFSKKKRLPPYIY